MAGPSRLQIAVLWGLSCLLFVGVILHFQSYSQKVDNFGDSQAYISVAAAIQKWDFRGLAIKHFWGVSYLTSALAVLTGISDRASLLIVCGVSSLISVLLAYELWGAWIAGFFAILNFDWLQRSYLGDSEPLFVALLFASFLMIRQRWELAGLLAALATTARPLGIVLLLVLGVGLLLRGEYCRLGFAAGIALAIGCLYVLPLKLYFHDPLATLHSYQGADRSLFGFPFYAIVQGMMAKRPLTNLLLGCGWVAFILAGFGLLLAADRTADYRRTRHEEVIFAGLYLLLILCYNYPYWALGSFPRFVIPVVGFALFGIISRIPQSRILSFCLYPLALICPVLAAISAIGVRNVLPALR